MLTNFISSEILLIFILSSALVAIALEIMIPSFGIIGILGIYLLIESILAIPNFENPYPSIFISLLIAAVVTVIIAKFLLKNINKNRLVLKENMSLAKGNRKKEISENFIGKSGIVVKVLRPSGEIKIEGEIYNAISNGDFISKDSKVLVEQIRGSQLVCKKID